MFVMRVRRQTFLVWLLAPWCLLALAQSDKRVLATPASVASVLLSASSELLLVVPTLRSPQVADALRRVAVERGVPVYLLVDPRWVAEPAAYTQGLSLVKGVQVRLLQGVHAMDAIVDRRVRLSGPLLLDGPNPLEARPTTAATQSAFVQPASNWFLGAWSKAKPFKYQIVVQPSTKPLGSPGRTQP